uniref:(northern house mosquito) hypothetical protein n=1 Tax=Culex pipiens TaxID=7175 RepID=A0A8D8BHZ9_CULPI
MVESTALGCGCSTDRVARTNVQTVRWTTGRSSARSWTETTLKFPAWRRTSSGFRSTASNPKISASCTAGLRTPTTTSCCGTRSGMGPPVPIRTSRTTCASMGTAERRVAITCSNRMPSWTSVASVGEATIPAATSTGCSRTATFTT